MSEYYLDSKERFVIENYQQKNPFSSFLSGIAGIKGIPMWVFYVNRGQGICSFGIKDKDNSIMEFFPANQAYQNVSTKGFRTFIKKTIDNNTTFYEPFSPTLNNRDSVEKMYIEPNILEIEENNKKEGLKINITYFNIPNEKFGGLVRKVNIKNISDYVMKLEILDGIPVILPFGINHMAYKSVGNTLKAWMDVFNIEKRIPYYKVRSSTEDTAQVTEINGGYFYISFISNEEELLQPLVDIENIFGYDTSLYYPQIFIKKPLKELLKMKKNTANKVPCGFSPIIKELQPKETIEFYTVIGYVNDINIINKQVKKITNVSYMKEKEKQSREVIRELTDDIKTKTSSKLFDLYVEQNYIDNILRGGYPILLEKDKDFFVYYVYSRKHGDLERDYNFFSILPEYYSQGNGNFRDTNQNRRNDIFFNPKIGDFNIKIFMNLIQADGYNPLVIKGCTFNIDEDKIHLLFSYIVNEEDKLKIKEILKNSYTPGKLLMFIEENKIKLSICEEEFLKKVLTYSTENFEAEFGEGYWIDHWTYNMDLIENYLSIYPDKKEELLFNKKDYMFYDSYAFVLPRKDKYVLVDGKPRQFDSIEIDEEKKKIIEKRTKMKYWVRTQKGKGTIYYTNLFVKLTSLALIKFATMDPYGMGIEMEANKPGWNDSMNGLPGIFGSSIAETMELKRIILFLLNIDKEDEYKILLPIEIFELLKTVEKYLNEYNSSENKNKDFIYWDQVAFAREKYREKIKFGLDGDEKEISIKEIKNILRKFLEKINKGIEKALEFGNGIYPTYFYFQVEDFEVLKEKGKVKLNKKGLPNVEVKKFSPVVMPYFLEGPTRALKVLNDSEKARVLYKNIRNSNIYDKKLKMYKICESLENQPYDIGRGRAFTPGWLENESIFLHMEYKYMLEILKANLYDEFFEDMKNVMIPFLNPNIYGRSTLENSSFIASSSNPDESVHGRGYVARLSGSTAEFLSMWNIMMVGKKPFILKDNKLCLCFSPILPGWLFDENGQVSFKFLGKCKVTYHNPSKKNTYGDNKVCIRKIILKTNENKIIEILGAYINEDNALKVRNGEIKDIDVYFTK
ncbi:hypothetical protein [Defluviitalea phaphyphila]|uniref:hypothetical protein n=1 Tax=Defluviitalea phaphyphila TaxID=1473580 RepID=UPI0007304A81|nr:hypothetical protein [Defluviitalea phaphyphila]